MKPIEILKKGLKQLQNQIGEQKSLLEAKLKANQSISEIDLDWLDNAGNLVDEERVVEALDNASDYERGLERLGLEEKALVDKLKELVTGAPSKKRKCMTSILKFEVY